jgi:reverse gyrase
MICYRGDCKLCSKHLEEEDPKDRNYCKECAEKNKEHRFRIDEIDRRLLLKVFIGFLKKVRVTKDNYKEIKSMIELANRISLFESTKIWGCYDPKDTRETVESYLKHFKEALSKIPEMKKED